MVGNLSGVDCEFMKILLAERKGQKKKKGKET
jgi:hypothetical protein